MASFLSPAANLQAAAALAHLLRRYRVLTLEMAKRELAEQYAGQVFGRAWILLHPLFMMGLYIFVFAVVFQAKIGGTPELPFDYTVYLLSGLVPWLSFQQSMARASSALTAQANLVKQVVFPIEILPAKSVLASLVPQFVGFTVLFVYVLATFGRLHATWLLLPVLFFFQLLAMSGIAFALSAIGAYLRDTKDLVQLFGAVGIYLVPVVYLPTWVPSLFKPLLYVNPFSYMIWCYQDALYFGRFEHPWAWPVFMIGSLLVFSLGYRGFRKLKSQLGNVL
jgi:lipopolysaccharide transport system permease protein